MFLAANNHHVRTTYPNIGRNCFVVFFVHVTLYAAHLNTFLLLTQPRPLQPRQTRFSIHWGQYMPSDFMPQLSHLRLKIICPPVTLFLVQAIGGMLNDALDHCHGNIHLALQRPASFCRCNIYQALFAFLAWFSVLA